MFVTSVWLQFRMSITGLTFKPPRIYYCVSRTRGSNSLRGSVLPSIRNAVVREKTGFLSRVDRDSIRRPKMMKSRVYAAFGDMDDGPTVVFPRIGIKDPYQRLGISKEASEEEIQAARNFLINKYGAHKPSVDAIESAHDKIIMQSFYNRKTPKIDFKKKVREASQSRVVKVITSRFEAPTTNVIIKTAIAFIVLGALTVLFPTEEGPTLQVAISLIASIYFIYARLKSRIRAFLYGIAAFFGSWLLGTLLMVSVVPTLLKGPRSLEVTTSLLSYVHLWVASTYLK